MDVRDMWRTCTQCGKEFNAGNNICPYCEHRNEQAPEETEHAERIGGIVNSILTLLNHLPGGSGKRYEAPPPPPPEPSHPMTIEEFDQWQAAVHLAGMPRRIHENFVRQRLHDEMMEELRRIRRE